jgi:predicted AlkP superfamily phosphohydrolase/phosphomutase
MSKARVMAVALDAADPGLVARLAAAGEMPAMARLLREAAVVETRAPAGVFVSANWPTIFTATLPDRHRYLCWDEFIGGTYDYRETTPEFVRGTPFWERLSEAGRSVAVFDVPHSIPRELNGVMVAEWGCHDRHLGTGSWPPGLAGELTERHGVHLGTREPPGRDQFAPCDYTHRAGAERTDEETAALYEELCRGVETKRSASVELLERGDWDLYLNVIGETHCIGHQMWHLHDPSHPRHDPALAARLGGDPVADVYRRVDAVVGEHLARLEPGDTAYLLFPHGMTAHNDGTHLLDHVLHRLDWGLDEPGGLGAATRAAGEVARFVPPPLRPGALRLAAPLIRRQAGDAAPGPLPAPPERRWFMTPNNTVVGAVRLNLAGREPSGRVHPADRRKVLRWLAQRLEELVNVDTGGRVVRRCEIVDDIYRRSPDDAFGDLFVEWERAAPIERVWSPAVGTVAVPYDHWRQGDHVREGRLLAVGPGIRRGRRRGTRPTVDIGATLAAAVGVELPGTDGRPIESVLPDGAARGRSGRGAAARRRAGRALSRRADRRVPGWARRQPAETRRTRNELSSLHGRVAELERHAEVMTMSSWLPRAHVPEDLLISVILPTRDRRALLAEALASVGRQSYSRWELLVVDDRSADGTAELLAGLDDPRIRVLNGPGAGACAARNVALEAARGDVVTYLDDDNALDPDWLRAVALTFSTLPETQVAYGARVCDDEGRVKTGTPTGRPWFQFSAWDPATLRHFNIADIGVLAHRPTALRFDESLKWLGDWDLFLRLTADVVPVEIPAVAVYYTSHADGRLSPDHGGDFEADGEYRAVIEKLAL